MHFLAVVLILPMLITSVVTAADSDVITDALLPTLSESADLGQEFAPSEDSLFASILSYGVTNDCSDDGFLPMNKARARRSQCLVTSPEQVTSPQILADNQLVTNMPGVTTSQEMAENEMMISQVGNIIDQSPSDFANPGHDYNANLGLSPVAKAVCHSLAISTRNLKEEVKCLNPLEPDREYLESIPDLHPDKSSEEPCFRFLPEERWAVCDSGNPNDNYKHGLTLFHSWGMFMISERREIQLTLTSTVFYYKTLRDCPKPVHKLWCCFIWYMTNERYEVHTLSFQRQNIPFDLTYLGV